MASSWAQPSQLPPANDFFSLERPPNTIVPSCLRLRLCYRDAGASYSTGNRHVAESSYDCLEVLLSTMEDVPFVMDAAIVKDPGSNPISTPVSGLLK